MREQLEQYVTLLFAGADNCEEIRQEILQNTLDRYDDLIAEGKVPEAAYRLAITGIGDINEILGSQSSNEIHQPSIATVIVPKENDNATKRLIRAIAVGLYILCPIPLIVLSQFGMDVLGVCALLTIVAIATVLIILGAKKGDEGVQEQEINLTPRQKLADCIDSLVTALGLVAYFSVSFTTGAWYITWVIFLITAAVNSLIKAIMDLKEAADHEN